MELTMVIVYCEDISPYQKQRINGRLSHILVDKTVNLAVIAAGWRVLLVLLTLLPCAHIAHKDTTSSTQHIMLPRNLIILSLQIRRSNS